MLLLLLLLLLLLQGLLQGLLAPDKDKVGELETLETETASWRLRGRVGEARGSNSARAGVDGRPLAFARGRGLWRGWTYSRLLQLAKRAC